VRKDRLHQDVFIKQIWKIIKWEKRSNN
jgi:hypothetical protein